MFRILILVSALLTATASAAWAASLEGWFMAGSQPEAFQMESDTSEFHSGGSSAHLFSTENSVRGFGTIMQSFDADEYRGKRVRLSAWVQSRDVQDWAGLWMRVDAKGSSVSFDNMADRPIKGSAEWTQHHIVLDVPENADTIALGALLSGTGELWVDDFELDLVPQSTPLTGQRQRRPLNLRFDD